MIISDLNYLQSVTEEAVIGGAPHFVVDKNIVANARLNFATSTNLVSNEVFNKNANIRVNSNVTGNSADLTFDNEALGPNSSTELTFQQVVSAGEGSSQIGSAVAAANR